MRLNHAIKGAIAFVLAVIMSQILDVIRIIEYFISLLNETIISFQHTYPAYGSIFPIAIPIGVVLFALYLTK